MNIAILGAGNGGQSAAGHLALLGHRVRLYDRFHEVVEPLMQEQRIHLTGAIEGHGQLECVTDDVATAVSGAEVILVTVPGFAFEYLATEMAHHLKEGQIVILHPGGTGGAFEVRRVWRDLKLNVPVALGATETLVYACRIQRPGQVDVKAVKNRIMVAALPAMDGPCVHRTFHHLYPQAVQVASVLETSFANTNPVIHPPIMLLNGRNIADDRPRFDFYGAGVSSEVARIIDAVDRERLAVAHAFDIPSRTHNEWVHTAYGLQGTDTAALCQSLSNEIYKGLESPASLQSRYLTEDVPLGLVPVSQFARLASVDTPVIDAIIDLASVVCGQDFRLSGRTLTRMGLDGHSVAEIQMVAGVQSHHMLRTELAAATLADD